MGPVFGVLTAVSTVVGTVASISASNKAADAREEAAEAREKQERLQRRRSSRQAIREAQIRRAQVVATAQGAGALGSSAVSGGVSSLSSQTGERLGFSSQYSSLSNIITEQNTLANRYDNLAGMWGNVASFSSNFADFSFGKPKQQQPQSGHNISGYSTQSGWTA